MFSNDIPKDRQALIESLKSQGIIAFEWNSGGNIMHVVIPIIGIFSEPYTIETEDSDLRLLVEEHIQKSSGDEFLYISTNSLQTECEIGVMGQNGVTGSQFASDEWIHADSLEDATMVVLNLWNERDKWIQNFIHQE